MRRADGGGRRGDLGPGRRSTRDLSGRGGRAALRRSAVGGGYTNVTAVVLAAPGSPLEAHPHHYVLRVPVPGLLRHTLRLHLKDETLIVSGEWEGGGAGGAVAYGSVYRAVPLPPDVIPAGFETRLEAGSFLVLLPRRPRRTRR